MSGPLLAHALAAHNLLVGLHASAVAAAGPADWPWAAASLRAFKRLQALPPHR